MKNKKKGLLSRITSSRVFRVMFARKTIVVCTILILVMILLAIFAPVVTKYDPNKDDLYNVLQGCSAEHWLGTDANGRDVLTRIIYGGRISFTVGLVAVCISSVIGMALGLIAGVVGGMVDTVIPADCIFVMGDNRDESRDSRDPTISFIPLAKVSGKVLWVLYPFEQWGSVYE